jgi:hypothetical protein
MAKRRLIAPDENGGPAVPAAPANDSTVNTLKEMSRFIEVVYPISDALKESDPELYDTNLRVHQAFKRYRVAATRPNPVFTYVKQYLKEGFSLEEIKLLMVGIEERVSRTSSVLAMQDGFLRHYRVHDPDAIASNLTTETGGKGEASHIQLFYEFAADVAKAIKFEVGAVQFHPRTLECFEHCVAYRDAHRTLPDTQEQLDEFLSDRGAVHTGRLNAALRSRPNSDLEGLAKRRIGISPDKPSGVELGRYVDEVFAPRGAEKMGLDGYRGAASTASGGGIAGATKSFLAKYMLAGGKLPAAVEDSVLKSMTPQAVAFEDANAPIAAVQKWLREASFEAGKELAGLIPPSFLAYSEKSSENQRKLMASVKKDESPLPQLLKSALSTLSREQNADRGSHIEAACEFAKHYLDNNVWADIHVNEDTGVECDHADSCRRMFMGLLVAAHEHTPPSRKNAEKVAQALIEAFDYVVKEDYYALQHAHMQAMVKEMQDARDRAKDAEELEQASRRLPWSNAVGLRPRLAAFGIAESPSLFIKPKQAAAKGTQGLTV